MALPETFPGPLDTITARNLYDELDTVARFAATCELVHLTVTTCGPGHALPDLVAEVGEALATNPATGAGYGHPVITRGERSRLRRRLEEHLIAVLRDETSGSAPGWECLQALLAAPGRLGLHAHRLAGHVGGQDVVHAAIRRAEQQPLRIPFELSSEQMYLVQVLLTDGVRLTDAIPVAHRLCEE